jgi:uncharacterized protein with HEPN domain
MLPENIKTWLYDITNAIEEIDSFFENKPKSFSDFKDDIKTKRAVERNLEIVGEALSRIKKQNTDFLLTNERKIIDTRNRIAHGYDTVSDDIIWSIVINHLPLLKTEVQNLLV